MFIGLNRFLRRERHVLATLVALVFAVMLLAFHGAASGDHLMDDHPMTSTMVTVCLAIIEAGMVLSVAGMFVLNRTERPCASAPRVFAIARRPLIRGIGPPGLRAAVLQVFLR